MDDTIRAGILKTGDEITVKRSWPVGWRFMVVMNGMTIRGWRLNRRDALIAAGNLIDSRL